MEIDFAAIGKTHVGGGVNLRITRNRRLGDNAEADGIPRKLTEAIFQPTPH